MLTSNTLTYRPLCKSVQLYRAKEKIFARSCKEKLLFIFKHRKVPGHYLFSMVFLSLRILSRKLTCSCVRCQKVLFEREKNVNGQFGTNNWTKNKLFQKCFPHSSKRNSLPHRNIHLEAKPL